MKSSKEQMFMLHSMCWKEINLLKVNLDKCIEKSERFQKLINQINSIERFGNNIYGLLVFDRYMTQMVAALNMARKYNIHLDINSLEQTVINISSNVCLDDANFSQERILKDFNEWKKDYFEKTLDTDCRSNALSGRFKISGHLSDIVQNKHLGCEKVGNRYHETNVKYVSDEGTAVYNKIDNLLDFLLPKKNFVEFKIGFEFEAYVVYVRDHTKLEFCICLKDDCETLYNLSNNINFIPILREFLPLDDVFCVLETGKTAEKNCIWRAVLVPEEHNELRKLAYLLDFGEVIELSDHYKTFEAPLHYKQIPPLAIKCRLEGVEDSLLNSIIKDSFKCRFELQKKEFDKAYFRVLRQKNQILHVIMVNTLNDEGSKFSTKHKGRNNLYLNVEYIDKANKTESSLALQFPRSDLSEICLPKQAALNVSIMVGIKIQIVVTHVVSPISFYGIIHNDYSGDQAIVSWHDQLIVKHQKQMPRPKLYDILLSQYAKDGYWYRAKVINIDLEHDLFKVFYIDFGNIELVPLSALAKCSNEQLKEPFQAVLFHISNLVLSDKEKAELVEDNFKSVIESVVVMILDQTINVEVVGHSRDDLFVRFIDSQYVGIPKMLIDMGVVKEL